MKKIFLMQQDLERMKKAIYNMVYLRKMGYDLEIKLVECRIDQKFVRVKYDLKQNIFEIDDGGFNFTWKREYIKNNNSKEILSRLKEVWEFRGMERYGYTSVQNFKYIEVKLLGGNMWKNKIYLSSSEKKIFSKIKKTNHSFLDFKIPNGWDEIYSLIQNPLKLMKKENWLDKILYWNYSTPLEYIKFGTGYAIECDCYGDFNSMDIEGPLPELKRNK
ncbi:MAG: hypothetical protein ACRCZR_07900 [Cetobacterium sp.]